MHIIECLKNALNAKNYYYRHHWLTKGHFAWYSVDKRFSVFIQLHVLSLATIILGGAVGSFL